MFIPPKTWTKDQSFEELEMVHGNFSASNLCCVHFGEGKVSYQLLHRVEDFIYIDIDIQTQSCRTWELVPFFKLIIRIWATIRQHSQIAIFFLFLWH